MVIATNNQVFSLQDSDEEWGEKIAHWFSNKFW